ncbi:MAG: NAD-dependent epimerase/dehydratase family protein [Solirubrobacterales bacterium]
MKACVTGATGFVGAHVAALLVGRGDEVRVTVRDRRRLRALEGLDVEVVDADVLDPRAMRRAVKGCDVLFHTAGVVASRPHNKVWRANAIAPRIAVEEAARADLGRVVVTSSVASIGPAPPDRAANERNSYPPGGTGLLYTDSKHEGEMAALGAAERLGIDVVPVCPSYVLGPAFNRGVPGETSTRIVANYMRGRLPAVVDAYTNIVDVEDVARGHLLAADRGRAGERYILGGENLRWSDVVDRIARISGVRHPLIVLPPEVVGVADALKRAHVPLGIVEGIRLMAPDWRYSSARARRELGYRPRGANATLRRTVAWCTELIEDDRLAAPSSRSFDVMTAGVRMADRLGLLAPLRAAGQMAGRRTVL